MQSSDDPAQAVAQALIAAGPDQLAKWILADDAVARSAAQWDLTAKTPKWRHRILWNKRDTDIDEIVIDHPASAHVEQLNPRCWWIGIYLSEDGEDVRRWTGYFQADNRGRMTFYQAECDLTWGRDESHDERWTPHRQ